MERDVKEVAAAAGGIEDGDGGKLFLELRQPVTACCRASAFDVGRGELALEFAPLPPERLHENRFDEGFDVGFAGIVGAELRALVFVQRALEEGAHDARLDKLPVGFTGGGKL